ncbi:MAG: DUF1275 domain-containing protein [Bdellovibrionaceae bacterium]|nr:DUF1275 domain-containing protein [Pseudobdellovibrionaceae bacterium]
MKDIILLPKNRFTWALLAFQGGFVNMGGLLTLHMFVSHITGFSSLFSLAITSGEWIKAIYFLLVPLFFLVGAFFSSLFTEQRKKKQQQPVYIQILSTLAFIFVLISVLGHNQYFGDFGEPFENIRDFILLSLLAFSCGSQNAIFTHYSNSIIRTTHLTGLTTDLGIGLAKVWISKDVKEKQINRIRIDLILSFIVGSLLGALIYPKLKFAAFIFPALTSLMVGLRLYYTRLNDRDLSLKTDG